ncbi:MAG: SDR family NAD(P)-dependent oxidoreductase, partial [Bacteroidota bacterium]|nr:SDR family NAD(P)-dependent oxidoreductase [Bacteroidota bacterium]
MKKIAFITGATSGIGWATAVALAKVGYRIIATGRRAVRLEALQKELDQEVFPLVFDVRDKLAVKEAIASLP